MLKIDVLRLTSVHFTAKSVLPVSFAWIQPVFIGLS